MRSGDTVFAEEVDISLCSFCDFRIPLDILDVVVLPNEKNTSVILNRV